MFYRSGGDPRRVYDIQFWPCMVKNSEFELEVLSVLWEEIKTVLPAFSGRKKRLRQEIVNLYKHM